MRKQKSKYALLIPEMRKNLWKTYRQATEQERLLGAQWYPYMGELLDGWAREKGLELRTVAALTAAISPQVAWEDNIKAAERLLQTGSCWGTNVLPRNARIAENILRERHLEPIGFKSAPKVWSFYRNLSGDLTTTVTIDTHMVQAAMGTPTVRVTLHEGIYRSFEAALLREAKRRQVVPASFQATIWLVWKRLHSPEEKRAAWRKRNA